MNYDIFNLLSESNLGLNLTHTIKHNFGFYFNSIYDLNKFYSKEEFQRDNPKYLYFEKIKNKKSLEKHLIYGKKN